MSQLNAFMDGLNDSRQQTERDTRLAMDIEGKRAAIAAQMSQESRASERMQMDRDRAIRETRDSDFDYEQKRGAAGREAQFTEEMKGWSQTYLAPQRVQGPDGQERQAPPKQATLGGQLEMYRDYMGILGKHGKLRPEMIKQYTEYGEQAKREGMMDAIVKAGMGDNSGLMAVAKQFGVSPQSIRMKTDVDPNTKLATTKLEGVGPDGKPFQFDFTPLLIANGLNYDPDKAGNDRALTGARINQANASAEGERMRGQAALRKADAYGQYRGAQANALTGGGGGVDFNAKESRDFQSALSQSKPKVNVLGRDIEDEPGREVLRSAGISYFRAQTNKGRRPSVQETMQAAQQTLDKYNGKTRDLLSSARFVIDPSTRAPRLTLDKDPAAVPFARIPDGPLRMQAFDQVRRYAIEDARRLAEEARRQQAIDTDDE